MASVQEKIEAGSWKIAASHFPFIDFCYKQTCRLNWVIVPLAGFSAEVAMIAYMVTILWDRLSGTFAAEEEKVEYGLVKQLGSNHLLWINAHEFVKIASDVKNSRRWKDAWFHIFGKPGWTAAAVTAEELLQDHEVPQTPS